MHAGCNFTQNDFITKVSIKFLRHYKVVRLKTKHSLFYVNFHESHSANEFNAPCIIEKARGFLKYV